MIHDNHGSRSQICIPAHVPAFQWVLLVVLPCSHLRWAEALRYFLWYAKYSGYHSVLFIYLDLTFFSTKKPVRFYITTTTHALRMVKSLPVEFILQKHYGGKYFLVHTWEGQTTLDGIKTILIALQTWILWWERRVRISTRGREAFRRGPRGVSLPW